MPLTPEHAAILLKSELRALETEHAITRRVIAAIPADQANFKPDAVAKSAFELAWHIASSEHTFLEAAAAGRFEAGTPRPESVRTPADIVAWYEERFASDLARLRNSSGEEVLRSLDFRGIARMSALSFMQLARSHSIHHRGQLSMYLRPIGAKVPSMYGESFDARQAREQVSRTP